MKTTDTLKAIEIVKNSETVKTIPVTCPCQMWKQLDALFTEHGEDSEIKVLRADGTLFKDFTVKHDKNGKRIKVNAVKETNRGFRKKAAAEAAKAAAEAKKAKRREYDRARRAAKKAAAAAAAQA